MKKILIIGVGNPLRGDDAAGVLVARQLKEIAPPAFDIKEMSGEGTQIMDTFQHYSHVILIDAVQSGSAPGRIHHLEAGIEKIPSDFFHYSTHAFSVAEAVEMSRALGQLSERVTVFGIEGKTWKAGAELTPAVEKSIKLVTTLVMNLCNSEEIKASA